MHEVGLMEEALRLALEALDRAQATCINRLVLRVGPLSGAEPQALRFAFEALAPGTPAARAVLEIHETPVRCCCRCCQAMYAPVDVAFACPRCGALDAEVRQGSELDVVSVEVS